MVKLEGKYADFDEENKCFYMKDNPYYNSRHNYKRFGKKYYLDKNAKIDERYRFKCSLAQTILFEFTNEIIWRYGSVCFNLSGFKGKFSNLEHLKNQSGYLSLYNLGISYKNRYENKLIFSGYCDNGEILDQKQMQRMFRLSGADVKDKSIFNPDKQIDEKLDNLFKLEQEHILNEISIQDSNYFEEEATKLDKWAKDIKIDLELKLKNIDKSIDEVNVKLRARNLTLKQRLDLQEKLTELEPKRKELRMKIYEEQDKIDEQRKQLIEETKEKLILKTESKKVQTIYCSVENYLKIRYNKKRG